MIIKLTCPVCSQPNIEGDKCPVCESNLSAIRILTELPAVAQPETNPKPLSALLPADFDIRYILILLIGIILGSAGYFWFAHLSPSPATEANLVPAPATPPQPIGINGFRYTVRSGDSLSLIALQFYGDKDLWPLILNANPYLKGRENYIEIGDVLIVPNQK